MSFLTVCSEIIAAKTNSKLQLLPYLPLLYQTMRMERTRGFAYLAENVSSVHLTKGLWPVIGREILRFFSTVFHFYFLFAFLKKEVLIEQCWPFIMCTDQEKV